jgi:hypothetical protein
MMYCVSKEVVSSMRATVEQKVGESRPVTFA